ncbi:conserved hypothetical protein [Gloeothece citriformis PCC 7424]|uniref:PRC-barrel domain protein n=1 Tax=Gloeothece citriformis (strain PCC 7424) TaxID=65393 RepID=B7KA81_GLOC7|nr:DUF2382 domain-containing protein [Gloeothece citriformis]ACK72855.1 conserved hypothetical protein [Gloeothece citriformis PCC 7424]
MSLLKIETYNSNYKNEIFRGEEVTHFEVYEDINKNKIGSVSTILVDEFGQLRYLVIDVRFMGLYKKVLLPINRSRLDYSNKRIYALNLTKNQLERLPEYREDMTVDYNYEEMLRSTYQTSGEQALVLYNYERQPNYDHSLIKLYEERLMANKNRQKIGEVALGKTVQMETARASIPVEKERVIIRRNRTNIDGHPVSPDDITFQEGEVVRVEIYEETANIQKQAFVREEINIMKIVESDLITAEETLRREELIMNREGNAIIEENS